MYLLPLIMSVCVFVVSTVGYFMLDEKKETLYGICSIVGAACAVVQLALLV